MFNAKTSIAYAEKSHFMQKQTYFKKENLIEVLLTG
jgi:hypothetical protein